MQEKTVIVWDLGATKCASAVVQYKNNELTILKQFRIAINECTSLLDLAKHIEQGLAIHYQDADAIIVGAAGQYDGNTLHLTGGYPYAMSFSDVAKQLMWPKMAVVHDYVPIICATFTDYLNKPNYLKWLNKGVMDPYGRRVAVGLGTGLGVKDAVLLPNNNFWLGHNEMGHIGLSCPPIVNKKYGARHRELLTFLRSENMLGEDKPLTFEAILSGKGTVRLHQFLTNSYQKSHPKEIGDLMRAGLANETKDILAWYLGLFIATIQLSFMPYGGIWLAGGVVLKHLAMLDLPAFKEGQYCAPAYLRERETFPLAVLCDDSHAFMGGAYYALNRLL